MRTSLPIALALGVLGACATESSVELALPNPPAGSETIHLLHADAHDVARTLNDRIEAEFWKNIPPSCALPLGVYSLERWKLVAPTQEATPPSAKASTVRELDLDEQVRLYAESTAEDLRWHLERPSVTVAGPHVVSPPPTFLAWDARTLVVLEAHREPDYFEHARDLARRLDAEAED